MSFNYNIHKYYVYFESFLIGFNYHICSNKIILFNLIVFIIQIIVYYFMLHNV